MKPNKVTHSHRGTSEEASVVMPTEGTVASQQGRDEYVGEHRGGVPALTYLCSMCVYCSNGLLSHLFFLL